MKKIILFLSVLMYLPLFAQSPNWNVMVVVEPYPTSFYSEWQNSASNSYVMVNYTGTTRAEYKVKFVLKNSTGKQLAELTSPVQVFESGAGSMTFHASDFLNWGDSKYDNATLQKIVRTNRFPEGFYDQMISILTPDKQTTLAQGTANFTIIYPDAPVLLDPQNGMTEDRQSPIFTWTQVNLPPTLSAKYNLRIVKRYPGQSISQAISVNPVHHEADIVNNISYVYPLSALAFENGKEYVWRVKVIDDEGNPLTSNEGNSEFWTFNYFSPGSPGSSLPFTTVELERNVAWFTDFTQTQITSDEQTYKINGSTTLFIRLSDGVTREFPAVVENLAFRKNRFNPFSFTSGRIYANIPEGALPSELITTQFRPQSIEYNTDEKLFLKGQAEIPGGKKPLLIPGIVPIKPGGILEATIKYKSGGGGSGSGSSHVPGVIFGNSMMNSGGFVGIGANPVPSLSPVHSAYNGIFAGTMQRGNLEGDPIYTFGNSAVRINITGYELVYPQAVAKFSGEVRIFNTYLAATLTNIVFNENGELTGNIDTNTPISIGFLSSDSGKYALKIQGVSGTFSYEPVSQVSSIDLSLKDAKFSANVSGLFSKPFSGTAVVTASLKHSSTSITDNGLKVTNLASFVSDGAAITDNPVKFGNSIMYAVNSMSFDSLDYTDSGLNFKFSLAMTVKFPGLKLNAGNLDNVAFTKRGISLPGLYSKEVQSDSGSSTVREINGFSLDFTTVTASALTWNGGTGGVSPQLAANLRFSNFPVGSSEDLFTLVQPVTAALNSTGMTITIPSKTFSSSFVAMGGGLKYLLSSLSGTITGTLANDVYSFAPALRVRGNLQLPANTFGNSAEEDLNLSSNELSINGYGRIIGNISGISSSINLSRGLFPVSITTYNLNFSESDSNQVVAASGSGSMSLSELTGGSQTANVNFNYSMSSKSWTSFSGGLSSEFTVNLPKLGSAFRLRAGTLGITNDGLKINGRGTVLYGTEGSSGATADNLLFGFDNALISSGRAVLDKGISIRVAPSSAGSPPELTFEEKAQSFPPQNGAYINTSGGIQIDSVGLIIASGSDSAYLTHNGMNYKTSVTFSELKINGNPARVVSGRADLMIGVSAAASLSSQGFTVNESALPSLPERIALLNAAVGYLKVKDNNTELVDWTVEGSNLRVNTRQGQPVKAVFPALTLNSGAAPEMPVSFSLLLDKSNYDIVGGSIQLNIPADNLAGFDLTAKGLPLKMKAFSFAKNSSGLYEIIFGSAVALFGEELNAENVNIKINGSGELTGDVNFTANKRINMRSGQDADKLVLQANTVAGSFNTPLIAYTSSQYELNVTGGIKLKMTGDTYSGANAKFRVTQSGIEVQDFAADDFSSPVKFDLGKLNLELKAFRLPEISYSSASGWNYNINLDAVLNFTVPGADFSVPQLNNIRLTHGGITFPVTQMNNVVNSAKTFLVDGFPLRVRNFRTEEFTVSSLDPASFNINNTPFRFDFTGVLTVFPTSYPASLRNTKLYIQNAGFVNGFLSGGADSTAYTYGSYPFIYYGNQGTIRISELDGDFAVKNNTQSLNVQLECYVGLQANLRAPGWIVIGNQGGTRVSIDSKGMITGSYLGQNEMTIRLGNADFIFPVGGTVNFSSVNGVQSIVVQSDRIQARVNFQVAEKATGSGDLTIDLTKSVIAAGSLELRPAFKASLPHLQNTFTFELGSAVISSAGITITGNHILLAGNDRLNASFSNFIMDPVNLTYKSGSFSVSQPFNLAVNSVTNGLKWTAVSTSFTPANSPSLVFRVPSVTVENNKFTLTGESTGSARFNDQVVTDFRVVFENSPEIEYSTSRVLKGSIAFYKGTTKAGFIDANGMNLTNMGSVTLPENLVLGDINTAYIKMRQGETKYVTTETVSNGLRIRNITGQTVQMYVPGIKYTAATAPVYNITLDVVVNPTTYSLVSGTISHQAQAGQNLSDLSTYGIPLKVTGVRYASGDLGYAFTVSGVTALPQVLRGLETELSNISVSNGRLSGFASNGAITDSYNPSAGYKKMLRVGTMAEFKMQGVEYTFGQNASYKISGDIKSKFFKYGTSDTATVHFNAAFSSGNFAFTLTSASSEGLKIGTFNFVPQAVQNSPAIAISFTNDNFSLALNGTLTAPAIAPGFEVTLRNLRIGKDAVAADPVNITTTAQEQKFTIFANEIKLKNVQNVSAVTSTYTSDVLTLNLGGELSLLGNNTVSLRDFRITSAGAISFGQGNPITAAAPIAVITNRLWVTALSVVNENNKYLLKVDGQYLLPAPAVQTKQNYSFKIKSDQLTSEAVHYQIVNEAPGIGSDQTEPKFWAGKFDLQYVGLEIDYSDYSASQLQTVSTFYVDSVSTHRYIKFGGVSGGTVEPGMSITFENKYEWAEELDFASEVKFTFRNLKYDLDGDDVEFEPDTSNGSFIMKIGGTVELGVTGFSGTLAFSGLEVHSNNEIKKFKESITGGTVTIAPLITVEITRIAFSSTPTDIYMPDPNGTKVQSGPDKGKVVTIKVPVKFYLALGGTVQLGMFAEGGIDSLLIFQRTDNTVNFVLQNFNFRKKDKIEFRLSMTMLTGTGSDFVLSMAGFCDFNGKVLAAVGKVAKWQGKFSAGLFVAALEGVEISFFGLVDLAGVGGGFFLNPTEADINTVRDMSGFVDEYTSAIKAKIKGAPVTGTPLFSIFLYARIEFGQPVPPSNEAPLAGNCLLTIANDRLIIDAKVEALGRRHELYGLANVEVSFTQRYVEGTIAMTVDLRYLITANATMQFFYYSQQNWGVIGSVNYKVLVNLLSGDGDFYAGSKGFYAAANFNQGFDVWILTVESGISLKAWYKPDVSWGAYFRLYLEASVLGGVASARGEIKGVLIGAPEFALAGGASLRVRLLFISWSGDVWLRIKKEGIRAGFGKDDAVQRLIAQAEGMSNDFLAAVNAAKADLQNSKPLPSLNIDSTVIKAASAELVKKMLKARSLTAGEQLSQAEKDSLATYLASELASGDDAKIREYLTKLKDNVLAAGTDAARTEITTLLNQLNTAINDYKTSIANVSQAVSNLAMTIEVPSATSPEGVTDPFESARFTYPTSRNEVPQSTDPGFSINTVTAQNNASVVNTFMSSAEGYHDMLKRNIEKIEGTITKFDQIFANPNNIYLGITFKYVTVVAQIQGYMKKLAQYHYNDITSANTFRTYLVSDSALFFGQIRSKDVADGAGRMKVKTYQRWARIRGLAATSQTPWDNGEFETVWGRFSTTQRSSEAAAMAKNLYFVIPDQAFFGLMNEKKDALARLNSEFAAKMQKVEEHAGAYTRMLDELFAKRRKMSENLFEVVERFIYWKDKPQRGANDKTIDFKNVAPTLATLQTKRTALVASNTAPSITVNSANQTNYKSHTEMSLSWSGTHVNGIAEYSLETSGMPGGFKTIGKYTNWYPYHFPDRKGEYDGYVTYKLRARSGSGFTKTVALYSGPVKLGFSDNNIGAPAQTVTASAPVDNTYPALAYPTIDELFKLSSSGIIYPGTTSIRTWYNAYYTNKLTDFRIRISAQDPESGISYYRYKIDRYNGPGNFVTVRDWQNIGAINEYFIQGLNLAHCATQREIQLSNYNRLPWYPAPSIPRYVISVEATNGAGLSLTQFVSIVVDTTLPPALTANAVRPPTTIRAITGHHQGTVFNSRYDTTSNRSVRPQREARKIVFPTNLANQQDIEYYYNIYAMPDGIRINQDYLVDNETYIESWASGTANIGVGKIATIPAQYDQYDQFKIELMYKTKSGAFSPIFTTTDWYYPYRKNPPQHTWNTGRGYATIDAFPRPPEVYWFNDRSPGQPNNLKLYFRNFGESLDGTGINRFYYSVGTVHTLTDHYSVNYLTWKELPAVSDDGIVSMDASFFSTWSSQSWFTPGNQIYVYIKGVNNSFWAGRNVTVVGPITLAPPTVASVSLDIIKDVTVTPNKYVAELTIGGENEATTKTYLVRTLVFRNGSWVAPAAPLTGAWTEVRNIFGVMNWHLTTKYKLNTLNMMPTRNVNAAGTGFQNMNERWKVEVKSRDNGGNESDIVSKEIIW